jgi:branched-chain amino acid transport system ATP-binding protein
MSDELKRDEDRPAAASSTRVQAPQVAGPDAVEADEALVGGRGQVVGGARGRPPGEAPRRPADALAGVAAEPGVAKPDPILIADDVTKSFGGVRAVRVDHLEVQRGTITALIGPNGAGKSTFFNLVSGFDKPDTGRWSFDGKDISGAPAYRIARMGMVRTFQLTKALMRLTTLENVMLGAPGQHGERMVASPFRWIWKSQEREVEQRADALLERFRLTHMRDEFAGIMSGGQRKLLEMARAMMVEPEMIMLDEPMAGVNPALTQSLLGHIERLRDEGTTIVLVEHDMDVIMSISDWIVVFAEGAIIAEGRPDDIRSNARVIEAYLGKRRALPGSSEAAQREAGDAGAPQEGRS